ncbi:hypothetical protein DJ021_13380 [Phenylobacterium hankyongense]|uniref:Uncharacterized protein n=1 Tax=Phenylobacterium hankyongense TaxID=1813876 RepID=A0A328B1E9_9CAUL|nr:hypothetical protein DJ021_13380 [Phenylobacterium hankyongense]
MKLVAALLFSCLLWGLVAWAVRAALQGTWAVPLPLAAVVAPLGLAILGLVYWAWSKGAPPRPQPELRHGPVDEPSARVE